MKTFEDSNGRQWELSITCSTIARVFDMCQIDMGDPNDGEIPLYVRILTGSGMLLKLLPVICHNQLQARGLSPESLLDALPPKNLLKIRSLFVEEWSGFFRDSGQPTAAQVIESMDRLSIAKMKLSPNSPELKKLEALLNTVSQDASQDATTLEESAGLTLVR